jgi:hypothetical protein
MSTTIERELIVALVQAQGQRDWEQEARLLPLIVRGNTRRITNRRTSANDYFFTRIAFGASECWYWTGHIDDLGYGTNAARHLGEVKAHRFAYRLFKGEIPPGQIVMHSCDVRSCVNAAHLSLGTQQENIADMNRKGRGKPPSPRSGEANPRSKLTYAAVGEIRALVASGAAQIELAHRYQVSPMTISRAVRGESWS